MAKPKAKSITLELASALDEIVGRFPIEGYAENMTKCKCLQFEDTDDCRHLRAAKLINKIKKGK